jgi:hypothetical protein
VNSFLHPLRLIKLEPAVFFRQLITLLRYPGLPARHSWRFALRHQNFNLAKHYDNLLRAKPLLRHLKSSFAKLTPSHRLVQKSRVRSRSGVAISSADTIRSPRGAIL